MTATLPPNRFKRALAASALSVIPGNRRRNSMAADSSPS